MILIHKAILLLLAFIGFTLPVITADFETDSLPEKLASTTKEFLDADTGAARAQMAKFSDEDLQRVTNAFKKGHSRSEQRIFWLVEEIYRRNAERVAAERIRYLYFAVLAALGIIAGFTAMTYARARRLTLPTPNSSPQVERGNKTPILRTAETRSQTTKPRKRTKK